ncbi:MAG: CBS domain-containing protein [Saprospiraceae bacterium]|nr:CBS domain-containing protein [Saprospiraceae bacterium]
MTYEKNEPFIICPQATAIDGMRKIDKNRHKILFVVDKSQKLLGSVTDGDIRRWILDGKKLDARLDIICNRNPITLHNESSKARTKELMLQKKINCIPVVNNANQIEDIVFWSDLFEEEEYHRPTPQLNVPVVIMAGGFGTRMEPFTQVLPKALIPIGDKTIIERIIDEFLRYQINEFYVSVNHKFRIIKYYLKELNPSYKMKFIQEEKPLGTAGSLHYLVGRTSGTLIVTNCDIIIYSRYDEIVKFHEQHDYDLTLVSSMMHYQVPYGTCEIDKGGRLLEIKEKPEYTYLVSTGMYILNARVLRLIPEGTFFHITHLMEKIKQNKGEIGVFPISSDSWVDTGQWEEYKRTIKRFNNDE